ncbi:MAG: hypothetical protein H6Q90_2987 [Deltaproteobacteria bacterium]|nr:hypothetical protein [Deltaproteobacteria bacterium]
MERAFAAGIRVFARIAETLGNLKPFTILVIGWAGLLVYAYPGYMSYDSVLQLTEGRAGVYTDWHPPAMAALWRLVDSVVPGPFGMLLIQSTSFLAGAFLLMRRVMSARAAAACAGLLLWFPAVSSTMAVIWKDSQMAGFLLLGIALMLSDRRRIKLTGLGFLLLGSMMRHNAFTATFPPVVLLFVWSANHGWLKRHAISIAIWLTITLSAQIFSGILTDKPQHLWHRSLALIDIVGTLSYADPIPDAELNAIFEGTPIVAKDDLQARARRAYNPEWAMDVVWSEPRRLFTEPTTAEQRNAITRAWKKIVFGNPGAYLSYRAEVFRTLIQLSDKPLGSAIYIWFTDIQDLQGSAQRLEHNASASKIQAAMQEGMVWLGTTWLFKPYMYLFLALALLVFCRRDRYVFALLASGLTSEAALFIIGPTADFRYSFWLVISTVMVSMILIAKRTGARPSKQADRHPDQDDHDHPVVVSEVG